MVHVQGCCRDTPLCWLALTSSSQNQHCVLTELPSSLCKQAANHKLCCLSTHAIWQRLWTHLSAMLQPLSHPKTCPQWDMLLEKSAGVDCLHGVHGATCTCPFSGS